MLILSRKVGEQVVVGEDITIQILGVKGKQIRIGIAAPKTVSVHRQEIYARIKEQEIKSQEEQYHAANESAGIIGAIAG